MVLADLDNSIGKGFFYAMLGVNDHTSDAKSRRFQKPPGLLIYFPVLGGNFLPVKVLSKLLAPGQDNAVPSAKEAAVNPDDNRLGS